MKLSDFNYELPIELIAQFPSKSRVDSRLLYVDNSNIFRDLSFSDLTSLVMPNDLFIFNNTKVMPARLNGNKPSGGKVEILIERILDNKYATAHIKTNKKVKKGTQVIIGDFLLNLISQSEGLFKIHLERGEDFKSLMRKYGSIPLPPYIDRKATQLDSDRYQTIFAKRPGAVAAPTAGLHFNQQLIKEIKDKGAQVAEITLHVGAGTFKPLRSEDLSNLSLHREWLEVNEDVCEKVRQTKKIGGRIIAVGTTTVRSLEAASLGGNIEPFCGETQLFIKPGFKFNVTDCMVTNFHLPKSSLLMLVSAFAEYDRIMLAYKHAIKNQYRFFSYGDAMWISRHNEKFLGLKS